MSTVASVCALPHAFSVKKFAILGIDLAVTLAIVGGLFVLSPGKAQLNDEEIAFQVEQTAQRMGTTTLSASGSLPALDLIFTAAPQGGWHIYLQTENFAYLDEPDAVTFAARGHAYLFVDGRAWGSMYTRLYHLSNLEPGRHRLDIFLVNRFAQVYTINGKPVGITRTVEVEQKDADPKPRMMKK